MAQVNTASRRDLSYERSQGVRDLVMALEEGVRIIFVSGRAGSGKSRLIRYLPNLPGGHRQAVVAPTGVAALALSASTIHSTFRLPLGIIDKTQLEDLSTRLPAWLSYIDRLVIDEISMVRADILDALDERLRQLRASPLPFGGIQIIMVGDFLQLPPVLCDGDHETLSALGYDSPFAFSAHALRGVSIRRVDLKKVWRQSDPHFIDILGAIREGRQTQDQLDWLNARCVRPHRAGVQPLILTPTREASDRYNREGLSWNGHGESRRFVARKWGSFMRPGASLPAPDQLELRCGARVMALRNEPDAGYVNGSLGTVVALSQVKTSSDQGEARVRFDHGAETSVGIARWVQYEHGWDGAGGHVTKLEIGQFEQIPLAAGYAMTIHKAQGLSLEDLHIDLGRGTFAPGQIYVALSRARSLEGLSLARDITMADCRVDHRLVDFLNWMGPSPSR